MITVELNIPNVADLLDRCERLAGDAVPGRRRPVLVLNRNCSIEILKLLWKGRECVPGRRVPDE
jgi:hypothetical protein